MAGRRYGAAHQGKRLLHGDSNLPYHSLTYIRQNVVPRFAPSLYYISQASIIVLFLIRQFGLVHRNLDVPFDFRGDTIWNLTIAKAIIRDGWWWHARSLAAPVGASLVAMPILGNLDCLILKLFSIFTQKAGLLLNLYWLTTIVLAGPVSALCLRRLGANRRVAFVLGILYALCPHIYYRHTAHLMLTHHLIPIVATLAVLLAIGRSESLRSTTHYVLLAGCVLVGFSYIYYSFFTCFVLLVGGIVGFLRGREYRIIRITGFAVGLVIVSTLMNLAPSIRSWITEPNGQKVIGFKPANDADNYGLKIRQLITPTERTPIPILGALAAKVKAAQYPLEYENKLSRMGTVASVGFLLLLAITVFWTMPQKTPLMEFLKACGALTLATVLFGTIGGFGSIFNLLVKPDVRAYNRISIFIIFFSLAAVALVLTKILDLLPKNRITAIGTFACLGLLLFVGVADQNEAYILTALLHDDEIKFQVQSQFVKQIESELPKDAMIFQLPQMPYSDGDTSSTRNPRVEAGAHEEAFIASTSTRWSWPAISDEAISFAHSVGLMDGADVVDSLRDRGFLGIYIDRLGYDDNGKDLITSIEAYVGRTPVESVDSRYVFFGLSNVVGKDRSERRKYEWGIPILFNPSIGVSKYLGDGWSCNGCTEGKLSTMYLSITPPLKDPTLKAHLTPALFGDIHEQPVRIFANNHLVGEWKVQQPGWYSIVVPRDFLENKSSLVLRFELPNAVSPKSIGLNADRRILGVSFEEMVMGLQP